MRPESLSKFVFPLGVSIAIILLVFACNKEIHTYAVFDDYVYSGVDINGGAWKSILVNDINEININHQYDQLTPEYQSSVEELIQKLENRTFAQDRSLKFWTNNPVVRWNEIALELAAKYNLIPPPNPDGTYTLPSAANPTGPPRFPFAHPPYTSRMLAHLSVAQFDGLITAWHFKYKYNIQGHHHINSRVEPVYTDNSLPPFPSDGAVIAEVSRRILKAFFPLEHGYLDSVYFDHLEVLANCGLFVSNDIDAGIQIGEQISAMVMQRAASDGMGQAQSPRIISDSIRDAAQTRFGWHWVNMESPVRPVGLVPSYGKVRMWSVPVVTLVRSVPPPAPGSAEFNRDADELKNIAKNLSNTQRKIANWWEDGLGSYTPPGHWNRLAKEFCLKYKLNPLRTARVFAYMNMAIQDAGIACWDTKYFYHYPRPIQTIPGFKTILGTPNFPAYTSGHSTFSAAGAEVLAYIFPQEASYCRDWAEEAAISRVYGGIHYRFDAEAGIEQGRKVAEYTINIASVDGAD
ncbi:MAG TPA: phosphatase PAP2 family protein [Saprospiraceae bacterium]|nr:phosphatase PAP2 family protein [Saprospiraceae bacterium]